MTCTDGTYTCRWASQNAISPATAASLMMSAVFARMDAPSVISAIRARSHGVRSIAVSEWCTRCSNDQLFSHRAGDTGRQVGVLIAPDRRK